MQLSSWSKLILVQNSWRMVVLGISAFIILQEGKVSLKLKIYQAQFFPKQRAIEYDKSYKEGCTMRLARWYYRKLLILKFSFLAKSTQILVLFNKITLNFVSRYNLKWNRIRIQWTTLQCNLKILKIEQMFKFVNEKLYAL